MGENKEVFELLKNGPALELKPKDVNGCIGRMRGESKEENKEEKKIKEMILAVESMLQSQSNGLEKIREFWKSYKF